MHEGLLGGPVRVGRDPRDTLADLSSLLSGFALPLNDLSKYLWQNRSYGGSDGARIGVPPETVPPRGGNRTTRPVSEILKECWTELAMVKRDHTLLKHHLSRATSRG